MSLSLRLRRTLSLSSIFLNRPISSLSIVHPLTPFNPTPTTPTPVSHFRAFRASAISLARPRNAFQNENDDFKIGPDDILFEGCDYNHWLITMDFPKDPQPSSEEMVQKYVETAAKIFGSVEEAKKKIYACSTTTYEGFQVECSEETSKKFEGLPGVIFVLPDSYVDPVNKEYGGDKYEYGIITRRPPPMQYGRTGGRFGDRNRDYNRPVRPRGEFNQGNLAYDNQGNRQGSAGNFGPTQLPPPQQNYGPPRVAPVNNTSGGQENYQGYGRDQMSPNQGNYNQGQRGNSYPQGPSVPPVNLNNTAPQPPQGGYFSQGTPGKPPVNINNNAPPPQPPQAGYFSEGAPGKPPVNFNNNAPPPQPPQGGYFSQGVPGKPPVNFNNNAPPPSPPQGGYFSQGAPGKPQVNFNNNAPPPQPPQGGYFSQGAPGRPPVNFNNNSQPPQSPQGGNFSQGPPGSYNQGAPGSYRQGSPGSYGQGTSGSYSQGAAGSYSQGAAGSYGQGAPGSYGQGAAGNRQDAGNSGQGSGGYFGQAAPGYFARVPTEDAPHEGEFPNYGENQRFSQGEQMNDMRQVQK